MRERILYYSIFILFGVSSSINAQRLYELTPYSFYQEWSLDSEESDDDGIVFKSNDNLKPIASNGNYSFLKFTRQNHVLYFQKPNASKIIKPVKRLNAPRKPHRTRPVCGNQYFGNKNKVKAYKGIKSHRKKGSWSVYIENDIRFLVLEHKVRENGKAYTVSKKEEFQIVSLKEDKMILRKLNDHVESF
jgi:hypothetical protein